MYNYQSRLSNKKINLIFHEEFGAHLIRSKLWTNKFVNIENQDRKVRILSIIAHWCI